MSKDAGLDANFPLGGDDALHLRLETSHVDGVILSIQNSHGSINLTGAEFQLICEKIDAFRVALHAVRGTQP